MKNVGGLLISDLDENNWSYLLILFSTKNSLSLSLSLSDTRQ